MRLASFVPKEAMPVLFLEILLPSVWLLVVGIVLAACIVSARGDADMAAAPDLGGWIEIGTLWLFAPEPRAEGGPGQSHIPDMLVRELSWV
jgi:hypothetical protein